MFGRTQNCSGADFAPSAVCYATLQLSGNSGPSLLELWLHFQMNPSVTSCLILLLSQETSSEEPANKLKPKSPHTPDVWRFTGQIPSGFLNITIIFFLLFLAPFQQFLKMSLKSLALRVIFLPGRMKRRLSSPPRRRK